MAAYAGKLLLIKKNTGTSGSPVWTSIGGLQTKGITINNTLVEITNDDSTYGVEYLAGAGITEFSVTGEGVSKDGSVDKALAAQAVDRTSSGFQVIVPGIGTFQGDMLVEQYQLTGTTKAEGRFQFTLKNAEGGMTFTAE